MMGYERLEDPPGQVSHILAAGRFAVVVGWDRLAGKSPAPAPSGFYRLIVESRGRPRRLLFGVDTTGMPN